MPDTDLLLGLTVRPQLLLEASLLLVSLAKTRDICTYPCLRSPALGSARRIQRRTDECEAGGLDSERGSGVPHPSVGSTLS